MLIIVSTKTIRDRIGLELADAVPFDDWIVVRSIPATKEKIFSLFRKHKISSPKGRLLFIIHSKNKQPSDFPGMFVNDWLTSQVFYENIYQLTAWIKALKKFDLKQSRKVFVLGMMKPYYMLWADKIYNSFHKSASYNGNTSKYLADTTTGAELAQKLSRGCSMAVYVGHGRSRGWSGYRGFRWKHMEETIQKNPVGVLFHFSCNGLKKNRTTLPFGLQWVISGRACSSIAACDSLPLKPLEAIAMAFMESVSTSEVTRIDEMLFLMNDKIKSLRDPDVEYCWQQFRLIGSPVQMIMNSE